MVTQIGGGLETDSLAPPHTFPQIFHQREVAEKDDAVRQISKVTAEFSTKLIINFWFSQLLFWGPCKGRPMLMQAAAFAPYYMLLDDSILEFYGETGLAGSLYVKNTLRTKHIAVQTRGLADKSCVSLQAVTKVELLFRDLYITVNVYLF